MSCNGLTNAEDQEGVRHSASEGETLRLSYLGTASATRWHRAKTASGLRRCSEGTRRRDEHARELDVPAKGFAGVDETRDRAEASEKVPYPWYPPLRRPLQLMRDKIR